MPENIPQKQERLWLTVLGSMNLAITILVVLAIASVIGTVLQQNQPYTDYIIKFGPFWHQVFKALGLYDVYGAVWFLLLLGFLLLSTSVCVYRNAPVMLRDMWHFRLKVQEKSLRSMANHRCWRVRLNGNQLLALAAGLFRKAGYRVRQAQHEDRLVLALMRGGLNRMGYLFTHVGIVVICVGGLLDGNLRLTIKEWRGDLVVERRDIPEREVPEESRLKPEDTLSFRGSITLPEESTANFVFLNVRDGYLVQELPFAVELKDFRIEHYPSGQPKSFESDLVIHDDQLEEPLHETIAVNHPLIYRGYAIYQASFGDGGSQLHLRLWPFFDPEPKSSEVKLKVRGEQPLRVNGESMTLELTEFKATNVFAVEEAEQKESGGKQYQNYGASFTAKVRDASGVAVEYLNFMSPVKQEGRYFYISGMRRAPNEPYRYLHIPMDPQGKVDRFFKFHALLNDPQRVAAIARRSAGHTLRNTKLKDSKMLAQIVQSMQQLVALYVSGGFEAIDNDIRQKVPKEKQAKMAEAYLKILRSVLHTAYLELLNDEGIAGDKKLSLADQQFFEDAMTGMPALTQYGAPFYLQLTDFQQREASGLQIARSPGKNVVYLGCLLLIVGIFMMFYIMPQRLWLTLQPEGDEVRLLLAGSGLRNKQDFDRHFQRLATVLEQQMKQAAGEEQVRRDN